MDNLLLYQTPSHLPSLWPSGSAVSCLPVPMVQEPCVPAFDKRYAEVITHEFSVYPPVQQLDSSILYVLMDWTQLRERVAEAETLVEDEQVQVDRSYISRACAAAAQAPDITLSNEDFRAMTAMKIRSARTLGIEYDEE